MALTARRRRFAEEYPLDLNATKAAERAGFSPKTAYSQGQRLLKNVEVRAAIDAALKARSERTELTADWVLSNLRTVAERCLQARPVRDKKGEPVMVETEDGVIAAAFTFDSAGANRALSLLGDHLGIFKEASPNGERELRITIIDPTRPADDAPPVRHGSGQGPAVTITDPTTRH